MQCFRKAFLIITAATVAGTLVSLVLMCRSRNFFQGRDIYAKFRDNAAASEEEAEGESTADNGRKGYSGDR